MQFALQVITLCANPLFFKSFLVAYFQGNIQLTVSILDANEDDSFSAGEYVSLKASVLSVSEGTKSTVEIIISNASFFDYETNKQLIISVYK